MQAPKTQSMEALLRELAQTQKALARAKACAKAFRDEWASVAEIKRAIETDPMYAQQLWEDLEFKTQQDLMLATTKGGVFTTRERELITSFWKVTMQDIE